MRRSPTRDIRALFDTELGQHVLGHLTKKFGIFRNIFDPNPTMLAWYAGRRDPVLHILHIVGRTPDQLKDMIRSEYAERDASTDNRDAHNLDPDNPYAG